MRSHVLNQRTSTNCRYERRYSKRERSFAMTLRYSQQAPHLTLDGLDVSVAFVLEADLAASVYQEGDGKTEDATIHFPDLFVSHDHGIIQSVFLIRDVYRLLLIIHRNADDLQPASAILPLPRNKARHFSETRYTPGRPKIE